MIPNSGAHSRGRNTVISVCSLDTHLDLVGISKVDDPFFKCN